MVPWEQDEAGNRSGTAVADDRGVLELEHTNPVSGVIAKRGRGLAAAAGEFEAQPPGEPCHAFGKFGVPFFPKGLTFQVRQVTI